MPWSVILRSTGVTVMILTSVYAVYVQMYIKLLEELLWVLQFETMEEPPEKELSGTFKKSKILPEGFSKCLSNRN